MALIEILDLWLRSSLPQDFLKGVTVKEIALCPGQSAGGTASWRDKNKFTGNFSFVGTAKNA